MSQYFNKQYFKFSGRYTLIGLAIGALIVNLQCVLTGHLMPLQDIILSLLFAILMTLCITNAIYFFDCLRRAEKISRIQFRLLFYACNIIGVVLSSELFYFGISLVFHTHYRFFSHFNDYRANLPIVLVVGTAIYYYNAQKRIGEIKLKEREIDLVKLKQLKTQAELQTLQSKINPHFLYNSLNSIASLIHEDADKAEDMTLKLSRLFRYSINSPKDNLASVTDEMETAATYLAIEKIRFGDRLNFTADIDKDASKKLIPRFLIQPLVENALKHGLNDMASNGELKISIETVGENITITVADNGKPFPAELSMGYGLQSTYDKLALLYGDNYQVQVTNSPQKQIKIIIPAAQ